MIEIAILLYYYQYYSLLRFFPSLLIVALIYLQYYAAHRFDWYGISLLTYHSHISVTQIVMPHPPIHILLSFF